MLGTQGGHLSFGNTAEAAPPTASHPDLDEDTGSDAAQGAACRHPCGVWKHTK